MQIGMTHRATIMMIVEVAAGPMTGANQVLVLEKAIGSNTGHKMTASQLHDVLWIHSLTSRANLLLSLVRQVQQSCYICSSVNGGNPTKEGGLLPGMAWQTFGSCHKPKAN